MNPFNFQTIDEKWQKKWEEKKSFAAPPWPSKGPPYYILVMFPYPSGKLHMGHVRNYTIGDVLARYYRRRGRSVLHPIGWDSFGLPAENAAIERGIDPAKWTLGNITEMRRQLKKLGISYDWDREIATCDPSYYRWNQWIFLKMREKGLAYRKTSPVNWCPTCSTVLANEQVHEGRCWRCESDVTQKELEQWFFKITQYAQELLDGHDQLSGAPLVSGWPDQVMAMQKNWIGRSVGTEVDFKVLDDQGKPTDEKIRVFTTRPDTLFGATFMVLAPEHPLVERITMPAHREKVDHYRAHTRTLTKLARTQLNRKKTGVFTGRYALNPVNRKSIPVWVADYVLTDYGTGAIMAVPAHDERDFEFAQSRGIPILPVIEPADHNLEDPLKAAYSGEGRMIHSGPYNGFPSAEVKGIISDALKKTGDGQVRVTYKLRDWLLSRQRYWGTPIPIVYCPACGEVPVPLEDLPVKLPSNVRFTGKGQSPLAQVEDWVNIACPSCGKPGQRETDTMDTFVDSSWYYARYLDPENENEPFSSRKAKEWLPVNQYVGGIEHACMHLIYARFFHKVMRDLQLVQSDEPFRSLLTQGMVTLGGSAMSKSKGNTVDPEEVIAKFGTDTCRLFILFAAPPTQQLEWSDKQVEGVWRFLNRLWRLGQHFTESVSSEGSKGLKRSMKASDKKITRIELERQIHSSIQRVTDDIERDFGFNTAIAAIMELVNAIYLFPDLSDGLAREAVETAIHLLSPFAPHITEELWESMGHETLLCQMPWPEAVPQKLIAQEDEVVIQVNGKLRDRIMVRTNSSESAVTSLALAALGKRGLTFSPQRVIYVPHKLVNFVIAKN